MSFACRLLPKIDEKVMDILREFVDKFRRYEFIRRGLDEEINYWGEDVPKMLLFSRIAREIAKISTLFLLLRG